MRTEIPGQWHDRNRHRRRILLERCERLFSLTSMYDEICGDLVEGYISISSRTQYHHENPDHYHDDFVP